MTVRGSPGNRIDGNGFIWWFVRITGWEGAAMRVCRGSADVAGCLSLPHPVSPPPPRITWL
jgi:hypothetical protein